jgi:hypothetical protein
MVDHWSLRGQDEGDDQSVQGQGFSENQNQDHSHEDFVLLGVGTHSCVSHNADGEASSLNQTKTTSELKPQQSPEARWA